VRDLDWALIGTPPKPGLMDLHDGPAVLSSVAFPVVHEASKVTPLTIARTALSGAGSLRHLSLALSGGMILPSLRFFLAHRQLLSIDEQAIAFASAFTAYSSVTHPGAMTGLAGGRQSFIHFALPRRALIEATT